MSARRFHKIKEIWKRIFTFVFRTLASPFYATIVTVSITITGLLGGFYPAEIQKTWPFTPWSSQQWSVQATAFWISVLVSAIFFLIREWVIDSDRRKQTHELTEQIRTLPPANFLSLFSLAYEKCVETQRRVSAEGKREDVERAIRLVLNTVASLAKTFDAAPEGTDYAANLMIHKSSESLRGREAEVKERLIFCEPDCVLAQLEGILDLQPELSAAAGSESNEIDKNIKPIALPIPRQKNSTIINRAGSAMRWRVLPGAPMAFATSKPSFFIDVSDLLAWCEAEGDFTLSVKQEISKYFTERAHIKGVASLPLGSAATGVSAVLNIHRSTPGLFKHSEPAIQFTLILRPLQTILIDLLNTLQTLQKK